MAVKYCSRPNCKSIMCDTHVDGVGYICSSCKKEFKEMAEKNNLNIQTEGAIKTALMGFMSSYKANPEDDNKTSINDFFNKYTR